MKHLMLAFALTCLVPLVAHAATKEEQRESIREMRKNTLDRLYRDEPETVQEVRNAVGHAVFTSADVAAIFVSGSFGHGIAYNSQTGQETFMKMASAGVGLGAGVKDFNTVFIFNNANSFHDFVNTGLDLSGNLDVALKQGEKGGAVSNSQDVLPGVKIYQLTDTGLMAQVMLKGTKFWQDADLNEYSPRTEAETQPKKLYQNAPQ